MKLATKHSPIGKIYTNLDPRQITLGWNNVDISPDVLVDHIVAGKPFAVAQFQNGHRKQANFIASDCIALDADGAVDHLNEMRPLNDDEYAQLLQHPIITTYAFAVIQSFSSKAGAYKCRILFRLSETITDAKTYKILVTFLMGLVPFIDPAPKDAARAFFGGQPGRPPDFLKLDNILEVTWLLEKINETYKKVAEKAQKRTSIKHTYTTSPGDIPAEKIRELLSYIPPRLSYQEWLSILIAVHSVFPNQQGIDLVEEWSPGKEGEVARKFASFEERTPDEKSEDISLGTLIFHAQQYGYGKKPKDVPLTEKVDELDVFESAKYRTSKAVKKRHIRKQGFDRPTVLLKSPIGTGKTELINDIARTKQRVLVIVHRQALALSMSKRLGIPCYTDLDDKQLINASRLVICINSLPKIMGSRGAQPYDFVALDEIVQQIEHLGGDTFTGREALDSYKALKYVISNARQVIGTDAGMNDLVTDWLSQLRHEVYCIENTYVVDRGDLTLYAKRERVISEAIQQVKDGHTIAIACGLGRSEVLGRMFREIVPENEVWVINRRNSSSREIQEKLASINESPMPRVLIYTPSLGSGFDITQPVDAVFGIFEGGWFNAPDVMQMLGRCRNTRKTHVYIPLIENGNRIEDWREIFQLDREAANFTALEGDFEADGQYVTTAAQDSLSKLLAIFQANRNREKNNLLAHFVSLVKSSGFNLLVCEDSDKGIAKQMKDAREAYQEETKQLVLDSEPITDEDLEEYKRRDELTPEVWAGNTRYHIEQTVGFNSLVEDDKLTPQMYDDLHEGRKRETLRTFTDVGLSDEILRSMDRKEAEIETLQAKRHHHLKRAKLLRSFFKEIFEVGSLTDLKNCTETFTSDVLAGRMLLWTKDHQDDLPRYFDRRKDRSNAPMAMIRWLLSRVGLKLNRQRQRDGDTLIYVFWLDPISIDRWLEYSESRTVFLENEYKRNHPSVPIPENDDISDSETRTKPPKQLGFDDIGDENAFT